MIGVVLFTGESHSRYLDLDYLLSMLVYKPKITVNNSVTFKYVKIYHIRYMSDAKCDISSTEIQSLVCHIV